jgi:hypothetical protein
MKTAFQGNCPICGKTFLRVELHAHILAEETRIRHETIKEILARNPGWALVHGACQSCWDTHRSLSEAARSATASKS